MTEKPTKFIDRHTYLGGSDAAAVVGVSPWKTRLGLYMEKTQQVERDEQQITTGVDPLYWGTVLERPIADASHKLGFKVRRVNKEYIHPDYPYLRAHIDRKVEGRSEMVEIKNIGYHTMKDWGEPETDQIPLHYMTQAFHYLGLTGYDTCHFMVLMGGQDLRHYALDRDEEAINILFEKEVEFWSLVESRSPPEPVDGPDLKLLFPQAVKGEILQASPATIGNLNMLQRATTEMKTAQDTVESFKNVIRYEMGTADTIIVGDDQIGATWKSGKRKSFDLQRFKEEHPELHAEYQKTTPTRSFLPKKLK